MKIYGSFYLTTLLLAKVTVVLIMLLTIYPEKTMATVNSPSSDNKLADGISNSLELSVERPRVLFKNGGFELTFELLQKGKEITFQEVPVKVYTTNGEVVEKLKLDKEKNTFTLTLKDEPLKVVIDEAQTLKRKLSESEEAGLTKGIEIELRKAPKVIEPKKLLSLTDVIEAVSDKKIIYIGEYHDKFSHHYLQKRFIEALYEKNKKIAIGMEMFQRPFQSVLDNYINGRIEEREFLKQTEYFKRWGFDYNLYKPILDLAREKTIPVIALNIRREITEKVSRFGIESLTDEEKKEIPEEIDFSDYRYRERLREVFKEHRRPEGNFEYFYQSQLLWDETMANSIAEFLKNAPDYQMVVLAGGGHIAYGSGIPKRAFRRNKAPYAVVLIDAELDRDIADFIIYPEPLEGIIAPKLMVSLKEENGKLIIVDLPEDSISKKAGLKKGDIILKIDNSPITTIEDLRIHLFYKKPGDSVKVTVLRRYFLFGEKEKEFVIKF